MWKDFPESEVNDLSFTVFLQLPAVAFRVSLFHGNFEKLFSSGVIFPINAVYFSVSDGIRSMSIGEGKGFIPVLGRVVLRM